MPCRPAESKEESALKASIESLRTPEERFAILPYFPYEPNYIDPLPGFSDLRMHYVDEGPKDLGRVALELSRQISLASACQINRLTFLITPTLFIVRA